MVYRGYLDWSIPSRIAAAYSIFEQRGRRHNARECWCLPLRCTGLGAVRRTTRFGAVTFRYSDQMTQVTAAILS